MSKKNKKLRKKNKNSFMVPEGIISGDSSYKFNLGVTFILIIFAFIIYFNSLHSPFIWDDHFLITDNHFIKDIANIGNIFKNQLYYSTAGSSNFYRPLQSMFLMLDFSLWKYNPVGYHITNIIFHFLSALVIFFFLKFIFQKKVIAFLVSFIFLIHPANSTVVNYISSRADSQATLFTLLAVFLFLKYIYNPKVRMYLLGSLLSFILGLMSKELAMIMPFLLIVTLPIFIKEHNLSNVRSKEIKNVVIFFIILLIYVALRKSILNFVSPDNTLPPPLSRRLLTTCESFIKLIGILFLPLKIHIEKSIPFSSGIFQPSTFFAFLKLSAIGLFMFWVRHRSRMCFFGLVWFFIALAPMSNIMPINATIADHWLYLPCLGLFLSVIGGIYDLVIVPNYKNKEKLKKILVSLFLSVVVIFSILTIKQNTIWHVPLNFYKRALIINPKSHRAHNEIGIIYLDRNNYAEAISSFKKAIKANSQFDQAYDNLGVAYDRSGDLKEAIIQHKKAIELNPNNPKTHNNLGNAYNNANRFDEAIESYEFALQLNPSYRAVYNNLGVIYYKQRKYLKAKKSWEKALLIDPDFKMALNNIKALERVFKSR